MEDLKKKMSIDMKRIYYLDVKKNRKDEMFLAITESKKVIMGEGDDSQVSFEKHKIFLYKEDFDKFMTGLTQAIEYINDQQGHIVKEEELTEEVQPTDEIKIDIDFE